MSTMLPALVEALNGSSLIEATLLLALCSLALHIPGTSSATRHGLLALGLTGSLLLPLLELALPSWGVEIAGLEAPLAPDAAVALAAPVKDESAWDDVKDAKHGGTAPDAAVRFRTASLEGMPASAEVAPAAGAPFARFVPAAAFGALLIWLGGAVALLVRLLVGRHRIAALSASAQEEADPWMLGVLERCRRKMALQRAVSIRLGEHIDMPFVCGIRRPHIVLPRAARSWPRARLESVLLHELGHVRRLDELFLLAGRTASAIYWFHPLVRRAERQARREGERACDDMVLALGMRPSEYASHLVDLVRSLPPAAPEPCALTAAGGDATELESRIAAILSPSRPRRWSSGTGLLLSSALLALLLSPVASIRLLAKPLPSQRQEKTSYARGMALHQSGRYDEAIAAFEESVAKGERIADATYNVACGRALQGRGEEAFAALALAVDRGFHEGEHMRGDGDLASLRSDARFAPLVDRAKESSRRAAAAKLEELRRTGEVDPGSWEEVGSTFLAERHLSEAIEALSRAADLAGREGDDDGTLYNLACAHALSGHVPQALDALQRAVDAGFDDAEHITGDEDLASLRGEKRFSEALVERLTARQAEEAAREAQEEARDAEEEAREAVEERTELEAQVSAEPDSGELWFELAMARYRDGDHAAAAEAFEKAVALHHREATSAYDAACSHALAGDAENAISWLARAGELGFDLGQAEGDPDMDPLRDDPRFRELIDTAHATHPRHRAII